MSVSYDRCQQFFEDHDDAACFISPDLRVTHANPAFACRFNVPADELVGMDYQELIPPEVSDRILIALSELTPDCPTCTLQLEMSKNGGFRVTEFRARAVFDTQGSLVEYLSFGRQLTEHIVTQRELERKNRFLDMIMEFLPVSIAIRDAKTRQFVLVNRTAGTEMTANGYIGKTFFELMPEAKARELTALDDQVVNDPSTTTSDEFFVDKADGRRRIHQRLRAVPGPGGEAEFILTHIEDVTDRWRILEELEASATSLRRSQAMARIGSWRWQLGSKTVEWSDQMYALWDQDPTVFTPRSHSIFRQIDEQDLSNVRSTIKMAIRSGEPGDVTFKLNRHDAKPTDIHLAIEVDRDDKSWALFGTCQDVTDRIEAEERIRQLACQDALTGLPNRFLFSDRLDIALSHASRGASKLAVHCLDLNDFKGVNDTLGHAVGDDLLCQVANRLTKLLRSSDTVARLGGDEFAIIQAPIKSPDEAVKFAELVIATLSVPYSVDGQDVLTSTSIGISLCPDNGTEAGQLLRFADTALYQAKTHGRGGLCFFSPEMQKRLQYRKKMELDLRGALDAKQFEIHYQPQYCLQSGIMVGGEALLRWTHPTRGVVPPDQFIPIAEDTGQILLLGRYVLLEACTEARRWLDAGAENLRVAVNLSPAQFMYQDLIDTVDWALDQANLPAECLELEITESMLMHDRVSTATTLRKMRDLGISLALDDFGTGYSSLSYLKRFPLDKIKIDRSFVTDLPNDPDAAALVETILNLSRSMGLRVVAEGVETEPQRRFLVDHCCHEAQGYLFSKPLPVTKFRKLLAAATDYGSHDVLADRRIGHQRLLS